MLYGTRRSARGLLCSAVPYLSFSDPEHACLAGSNLGRSKKGYLDTINAGSGLPTPQYSSTSCFLGIPAASSVIRIGNSWRRASHLPKLTNCLLLLPIRSGRREVTSSLMRLSRSRCDCDQCAMSSRSTLNSSSNISSPVLTICLGLGTSC